MLSRNDVGSREHVQMWLDTKKADEGYDWQSGFCPAGQYSREFGDEHTGLNLNRLNDLAHTQPHTWGALSERARASGEPSKRLGLRSGSERS